MNSKGLSVDAKPVSRSPEGMTDGEAGPRRPMAGACMRAGQTGGESTAQKDTWSAVEYSTPHFESS